MTLSRRSFVRTLGIGGAGGLLVSRGTLVTARGREALAGAAPWEHDAALAADAAAIRLNSNENPLGPGAHVLAAIQDAFGEASRYPFAPESSVQKAIARAHGVPEDHVLMGCGSGEILRTAVAAFTSPSLALVAGSPTFEDPAHYARVMGSPVRDVAVDANLKLDLAGMLREAGGAGLVFFCNPNNPTATVHGAEAVKDFAAAVNKSSPSTTLLIDEAYHEYVDDASYRTAVPIAAANPRVVVSRTFSKVFGMAGLRIGYAIGQPQTLERMRRHKLGAGMNVLAAQGALAAISASSHIETERRRNRDVREFTRTSLARMGYPAPPSEANFVMVDVRRDVTPVIEACRRAGVLIGRPFPPLTRRARISIGTMDEMRRAMDVLSGVLGARTSAARG